MIDPTTPETPSDSPAPSPAFGATLSERAGYAVLSVAGEIDMTTAHLLRSALDNAHRGRALVADMGGVTFFGAVGLTILLRATSAHPGTVAVVAPAGRVRRTIAAAGARSRLNLHDNLDSAVGSLVPAGGPLVTAVEPPCSAAS
ncbi:MULTISPECIES: STAS domain-containing protein [unclassified Rhodococcus (in: high G+C Gram-positive bacteria)]|uniref:STAS domain-containing protein n=1 Tax=unclassified Rhodococcus (in: high G+C Gram-positive bacteria) TaxID=192944 RepID=UPI00092A85AA|nr:STAS domain-containing protein [Rhodococcus sp. M8]OLL20491.1 hypothetical protein BKE56_011340 [Rhodococcus sp. M8]QPG44334.1 STAS domain-containing protein [Rhodococcus sp. M8]